jgi:hypothetical protein
MPMSAATHVAALEEKHAILENEIDHEVHRPAPDSLRLTTLKREKLKIKEELERLAGA